MMHYIRVEKENCRVWLRMEGTDGIPEFQEFFLPIGSIIVVEDE